MPQTQEAMPPSSPPSALPDGFYARLLKLFQTGQDPVAASLLNADSSVSPAALLDSLAGRAAGEGEWAWALAFYREALRRSPQDALLWAKLGLVGLASGMEPVAKEGFAGAAEWKSPAETLALVRELKNGRQREAARRLVHEVIGRHPESAEAWFIGGELELEAGRPAEAAQAFKRTLALRPDRPEVWYQMANALVSLGDFEQAGFCLERTVALRPNFVEAWNNLGNIRAGKGDLDGARNAYQTAIDRQPSYAQAHYNLGNLFANHFGRPQEAIQAYRRAIEHDPRYAAAHNNLGHVLMYQGRLDQAAQCFETARTLAPDFAQAHHNLGNLLLLRSNHPDRAAFCFEKALDVKPDYTDAAVALLDALQQACAWEKIGPLKTRVEAMTRADRAAGRPVAENPLLSLRLDADPARNLEVAKAYTRRMLAALPRRDPAWTFEARKTLRTRLTIGYLSSDFRDHPVGHLVTGLFRHHDRDRFRILAYANGSNDQSAQRRFIEASADAFVDLTGMGALDRARRIYMDHVDVLVDLTGHTRDGLMSVPALRPAPVQVGYLGFLGSSGADFIDYIVTDRVVTPPDQAVHYTERFLYMPHTYQVNDGNLEAAPEPARPKDWGLPEDAFVFCSFNDPYKIDAGIFDTWMNILKKTPSSVLWLLDKNEPARRRLVETARAKGIHPDRLVFAGRVPLPDHLARLRLADLALDTFTYNGGATTSNALWAGLPVVTTPGGHFVSRMTASALMAVGLPQLIASDQNEYERLAVRLALNPGERSALRGHLIHQGPQTPLFDTPRFVRSLEAGLRLVWERFAAGQSPEAIDAPDL